MTPAQGQPQHAVDTWFAGHARVWDDTYHDAAVSARVYQRRQILALDWVDGLGLEPAAQVLEIGCGAGHATAALAQRGLKVAAIDTVPRMLGLARGRVAEQQVNHHVRFAYSDAHALGFADASFQLVVALGVIPWLHSPGLALREMARVLQPGGWCIVTADNRLRLTHLFDPRLSPALGGARRVARRLVRAATREPDRLPRMHSPDELDALLEASGLAKRAAATCGYGPFTLMGRPVATGPAAVALDGALQRRLADTRRPWLCNSGAQYLVLGQRS